MNDWRKECLLSENCLLEFCILVLLRDVFIKCGFLVLVFVVVLIYFGALEIYKSLRGLEERYFVC